MAGRPPKVRITLHRETLLAALRSDLARFYSTTEREECEQRSGQRLLRKLA